MKALRHARGFVTALQHLSGVRSRSKEEVRIGLALGGGFARGIAHTGVLKVLQRRGIAIHCITGVSSGSIVAAAFASGASPDEIARAGCAMRFGDVASWRLCRMGFAASEPMTNFLERLLKRYRFEDMPIPLGMLASDLATGESVSFHGSGDVIVPIRASCSYPCLFRPVAWKGRLLVDGAITMEIPALLARQLGATHVISVHLPVPSGGPAPSNVFQVMNRSFQIMQTHAEDGWRRHSDLVIAPDVSGVEWDGFECALKLIEVGEAAAEAAIPEIRHWLPESASPARELSPIGAPGSLPA